MADPRKCENLLASFMQWTLPRSEAKESYIFWTGLFTLSCVLRRHVFVPKRKMGSYDIYPYLYLLFIGPSGNRKTTTSSYNIELLSKVIKLQASPDKVTVEKLASTLAEAEECAMYINAGELSEFIAKSGKDMYSFLTAAFDGKTNISIGTHIRGIELAEKPCVNFLGATTPEWIAANMPQDVLHGGFGSRCMFIFEETVRKRQLFYDDIDVDKLYDDHFQNLVDDLNFISQNIFGDFSVTQRGTKNLEEWYQDGAGLTKLPKQKAIRLKGYYERKPNHVMKIAMLLKISDGDIISGDQLVLDWQDFEEGIAVVESLEANLHHVIGGVGKNVYRLDAREIFEFIRDYNPNGNGHYDGVKRSIILQNFDHVAEPEKLIQLINGMAAANYVDIMTGVDPIIKAKTRQE